MDRMNLPIVHQVKGIVMVSHSTYIGIAIVYPIAGTITNFSELVVIREIAIMRANIHTRNEIHLNRTQNSTSNDKQMMDFFKQAHQRPFPNWSVDGKLNIVIKSL